MLNTEMIINSEKKSADFQGRAQRAALGAFLRDINSKITEIPQCSALGTTLHDIKVFMAKESTKAQMNLHICAVSPEHQLLTSIR